VKRSTLAIVAILVLAFGGMMLAANWTMKTFEGDLRQSRELTDLLLHRDLVEPGSRVLVLSKRGGGEKRLAPDGEGVYVELTPSRTVRERRGGLADLTDFVGRELLEAAHDRKVDWFEYRLIRVRDDGSSEELRTLVRTDEHGRPRDPEPPLPVAWGPGAAAPGAPPGR
jgi:hypothetical protein